MAELRPCECRCRKIILESEYDSGRKYRVRCWKCGKSTFWYYKEEQAVNVWNNGG